MNRTGILGGALAALLVIAFAVACALPVRARLQKPDDVPKSIPLPPGAPEPMVFGKGTGPRGPEARRKVKASKPSSTAWPN